MMFTFTDLTHRSRVFLFFHAYSHPYNFQRLRLHETNVYSTKKNRWMDVDGGCVQEWVSQTKVESKSKVIVYCVL